MLRLSILAIALLIGSAISGGAETLGCSQAQSTARLRWAAVRKNHADPAHHEENCRSYAANFFDAVTALRLRPSAKTSRGLAHVRSFLKPTMNSRCWPPAQCAMNGNPKVSILRRSAISAITVVRRQMPAAALSAGRARRAAAGLFGSRRAHPRTVAASPYRPGSYPSPDARAQTAWRLRSGS
jgi:hypothetical protein